MAIARGGMTVAQILSDFLSLPLPPLPCQVIKTSVRKIFGDFLSRGGRFKNKRILLVDDVSDTGKTFERGIQYLNKLGVVSVVTAALLVNPKANMFRIFCEKNKLLDCVSL